MEYDEFLAMKEDITQKIPEELNNNRELVIDVLYKNGMALESVAESLRDDYDVVETAIKQNALALQFASNRLQDDFAIVMSAVLENGWALQFASEALRDNAEIVNCAMWTDNTVLEFASSYIKKLHDPIAQLADGKDISLIVKSSENKLPKSGRLSYAKIKELYTEAQEIRSELHKSQSEEILNRLDAFIDEIHRISKSSSTYLDSDEVASDLEWIIEYYEKKEWLNVTRWLCNIDSSLREMWSNYIEKIIAHKNQQVGHCEQTDQ